MPSTVPDASAIHVAVGVIEGEDGRILLTRRPEHVHQGGKWEFPGGKVEQGESVLEALERELQEELNITPESCTPLITIPFRYPEKSVYLDVWVVHRFKGVPVPLESQPMTWVRRKELQLLEFPKANQPIINALNLPGQVLITPPGLSGSSLIDGVEHTLQDADSLMIYLRTAADNISPDLIKSLQSMGAKVLTRSDYDGTEADGVHLTSHELMQLKERPETGRLLSASCHSPDEIEQANRLRLDFIFLSPVKHTQTHPEAEAIGWALFSSWVKAAGMPVYALGGMRTDDISIAQAHGGQGIAGIRGLWNGDSR
jgi:8-oxo-dGTP diphosphatase